MENSIFPLIPWKKTGPQGLLDFSTKIHRLPGNGKITHRRLLHIWITSEETVESTARERTGSERSKLYKLYIAGRRDRRLKTPLSGRMGSICPPLVDVHR